jgi:hypothetical protein
VSLTSFLTQNPAQYAPGTSQSYSSLPQWYTDYASGILSNASQYANQQAPIYPGPQVAPLTQDQQSSYGTVQGQQGVGSGIAQQGVNSLNQSMAQPNAAQAGNPYLASAQRGIQNALGMQNASQAAQPYMNQADQPLSQTMQQFMNPYSQQVVNANNALTNQAFRDQVMPSLQNQFTQAGQVYGGSNQGTYAAQLGQRLQANELASNANTLSQGFNTALGGAQAQAGIQSGLANTAGNLANAAQGTGLYGAGLTSGIGSTAGSLANAAQQTGISGGLGLGSLGSTVENNALNQALMQNQMGQQQQAQTQANYNVGMNNYMQQFNWPMQGAQAMGSALSGIQVPQGSTNYTYGLQGMGAGSPLQQGIGAGSGIAGILQGFGIAAKGGHVRMARGGQVKRKTIRPKFYSPLAEAAYG